MFIKDPWSIPVRIVQMPSGGFWSNPLVTGLIGIVVGFTLEPFKKYVQDYIQERSEDRRTTRELSAEIGLYLAQVEASTSGFLKEKISRGRPSFDAFEFHKGKYPVKFSAGNRFAAVRKFIEHAEEQETTSREPYFNTDTWSRLSSSALGKSIQNAYKESRDTALRNYPLMFPDPKRSSVKTRVKTARNEISRELGEFLAGVERRDNGTGLAYYDHYLKHDLEVWTIVDTDHALSNFVQNMRHCEYLDDFRAAVRPYAEELLATSEGGLINRVYLSNRRQDGEPYFNPKKLK
jgi:hypothetical protein